MRYTPEKEREAIKYFGKERFIELDNDKFDLAWERNNPKTLEEVNDFYKKDEVYLVRQLQYLPSFIENRREIISKILNIPREKYQQLNVLDYGCGAGNLIIPLAEIGLNVSGVEVKDSELSKLLKWRFDKRFLTLNYYGHEDNLPENQDVVICWDVLEHLTDVRGSLDKMLCCLKQGGLLFLSYGWHERISYPPLYEAEKEDGFIKEWLNNFDQQEATIYFKK